jgi:hypothetical protein
LQAVVFHFGQIWVAGHQILDKFPKRRRAIFFLVPFSVLGLMLFSGETASLCIWGGNDVTANETTSFVLVGETTLFPEGP